MKTQNGIWITNAYGINFKNMTKEELVICLQNMNSETYMNWYFNEGTKYQSKHKKTREYLQSLIQSI
jgi:hypothetical protein